MKQNFLWADDKHGTFDKQLLIGEWQACVSSLKEDSRKKIDVTVAPFECINLCICHLYWNTVYFIIYKFKTEEEAKLYSWCIWKITFNDIHFAKYTYNIFPGFLIPETNSGMQKGWYTLQNITFKQLSTKLNIYIF